MNTSGVPTELVSTGADEGTLGIPLFVEEKAGIPRYHEPVTVSVPLPEGKVLDTDGFKLFNERHESVPLQVQALGRWFDDSIKWALLDFQACVQPREIVKYQLIYSNKCEKEESFSSLRVEKDASGMMVVDTGNAAFFINPHVLKPFERVVVEGRDVLEKGGSRVLLTDVNGRSLETRILDASLEIEGPLRAIVTLRGKFIRSSKTDFADFIARLNFFLHSSVVEMNFTLRNSNAARHQGGLWDLGDEGSIRFRDVTIQSGLPGFDQVTTTWNTTGGDSWNGKSHSGIEIYQDSSGGKNWMSPIHVNAERRVTHSFSGFRVRQNGKMLEEGNRTLPIVRLEGEQGSQTVAIDKFWQNFPKALEVQGRHLYVRLFPHQYEDDYELQGGEQKTHTVFFQFQRNGKNALPALSWVHHRLLPFAGPEWCAQSKAVGYLTPRIHDRNAEYLQLIDSVIEGENSFFERRERIDEFGWRHFGEVFADHEAVHHTGNVPFISHYNNQYDVVNGLLVEYMRTGDRRWYTLMSALARHVVDIDIYHTQKDRAAYNGGLFWHSEHYTDAATATHRTYSKFNVGEHHGGVYGGGPSNEHNYSTGLLHYFYLTGDPLVYEVVLGLADWVINMDDGKNRPFGWCDPRPTGLASATGSRHYHGPGRGSGNSINVLLDAFLLVRRPEYLFKAEELIRRCIHPNEDIEKRGLDNIEYRWSYTVFLMALGKFLDLKVAKKEWDYMFHYARASLLRYAAWMADHEVPYAQVLDRVEIPTETWPAQDMRKSAVFKLAAKYAEEPVRSVYLQKSDFFFSTCLKDLLSFKTCRLVRPLVLLLVSGYYHAYFQTNPHEMVPPSGKSYDYGRPQPFSPQFAEVFQIRDMIGRVVNRVKSGVLRLLRHSEVSHS